MTTNQLAGQQSLYLAQHASNPVAWYPWNAEALALAKEQNKPILLSIGYSACHWCHVMAHESFEDELTAQLMNEHYINIKVDREERPDLDKVYQLAHQMLTQRGGGWPLTVFLAPDTLMPFFAGTYFPPERRHGLPAFREVLTGLHQAHQNNPDALVEQASKVSDLLGRMVTQEANAHMPSSDDVRMAWQRAIDETVGSFDIQNGGFGGAPKFPHPPTLKLLFDEATLHKNDHAKTMLQRTLDNMAARGQCDQLGGGFYRYCVDEAWQIPHFEKMLYDNGLLLETYALSGHLQVAKDIIHWVSSEMTSDSGTIYSTLDADSLDAAGHSVEGAYYTWAIEEAQQVLDADEWRIFAMATEMDGPPNFEGRWHLQRQRPMTDVAMMTGRSVEQAVALYHSAATKLQAVRAQRAMPGRDEKVLCAWNALYLNGLVAAGEFKQAMTLFRGIHNAIENAESSFKKFVVPAVLNSSAPTHGYLDDYAYLLNACINLLEAQWDADVLSLSRAVADELLLGFEDQEQGGFYFTHSDAERLIYRPKPYADDAIPAGNALAIQGLWGLGLLLSEPRYLTAATKAAQSGWPDTAQYPQSHASMLSAIYAMQRRQWSLLITGPEAKQWQANIVQEDLQVYAVTNKQHLPPVLVDKFNGKTVAWLCGTDRCMPPMDSEPALIDALRDLK